MADNSVLLSPLGEFTIPNCSSSTSSEDCNGSNSMSPWDSNYTTLSSGFGCSQTLMTSLEVENPEDFRYPWISNKHFYPNILTYLVTMIFGLVGNITFIAVIAGGSITLAGQNIHLKVIDFDNISPYVISKSFLSARCIGFYAIGEQLLLSSISFSAHRWAKVAGDRKVRTTTNVFLVSLTVADLLMLSICAPLEIVRLFVVLLNFGGAACRMGHYFMMLSFTASVLNLTAVSLERFIVIAYPMRARSLCTLSNCRKSVLFVWAASLILACPSIWVMGEESTVYTDAERTTCVVAYYCRDIDSLLFPTYRLLVLFCIPGVLMSAFYTAVIRELWLSTRNINILTNHGRSPSEQSCLMKSDSYHMNVSTSHNSFDRHSLDGDRHRHNVRSFEAKSSSVYNIPLTSQQTSREHQCHSSHIGTRSVVRFQVPNSSAKRRFREKGDDVKRARKQVIKMLIVIVLLFVLCWGPNIIIEMLIGLGKQTFTQEFYVVKWVSSLLPFVHCCINPVIYCFMSKNFRTSMAKALSYPCRCCKGSSEHKNGIHSETFSTEVCN